MASLLLDTTFLIDVERDDALLDELVDDADDVAIAAITVAELQVGVELAEGERRQRRENFVSAIVASIPVLAYDTETAMHHAALLAASRRSGMPRGPHDLLIAATARSAGRTVVSADARGFEDLPGVELRCHR